MSLLDSPDADRGAVLTGPETHDIFSTQKKNMKEASGSQLHLFAVTSFL